MHCHKTGLCAQCTHPETRLPEHCTLSAQVVCTVERTTDWSRACRAHSQRMSRAQRAQVARIAPRSWAQVTTSLLPNQNHPSCDLKNWGRDTNFHRAVRTMSRHHSGQSRSRPPNRVMTPFLLSSPKPGRNTKTRSQPSWRLPYVTTSISCCDLIYAHIGISRS